MTNKEDARQVREILEEGRVALEALVTKLAALEAPASPAKGRRGKQGAPPPLCDLAAIGQRLAASTDLPRGVEGPALREDTRALLGEVSWLRGLVGRIQDHALGREHAESCPASRHNVCGQRRGLGRWLCNGEDHEATRKQCWEDQRLTCDCGLTELVDLLGVGV